MAIRIHHADDGLPVNSEINVTPFIDVMLVLLVIFMITAPLTTVDIPIKLPVAKAAAAPEPSKPVYISLQANGSTAVGNERVPLAEIASVIERTTKGNRETQLFLRGDRDVAYSHLMDLLSNLREAGYLKVALVGLQSDDRAQASRVAH